MAENENKKKRGNTSNSVKKNGAKKNVNSTNKSVNKERISKSNNSTKKNVNNNVKKNTNTEKGKSSLNKNFESKKSDDIKTKTQVNEKKDNLKEARKQLYYNNSNEGDEFSKLFKIILIVTAIIVVFYGVTVVVTNKADEAREEANSEPVEIQYDSIMIGSMLNINGTFYVLISDDNDIRLNEYTTMIQTIKANDDAPTIYTADLSSAFNKTYLGDDSNYDSDMNKFKVKGTTLVRIDDHEIQDVYDNYDEIIEKLKELD